MHKPCSRVGDCNVEGDCFELENCPDTKSYLFSRNHVFGLFCLTCFGIHVQEANACFVFSLCRTPELAWADATLTEKVVYLYTLHIA